mgnify:CR=1 FL=1
MNILILGNGDEELYWAQWFLDRPEHHLVGGFPGFPEADLPLPFAPYADLDAALAIPGVDLVIVGGEPEFRMESLRRVAALGWPSICLHPPGPDSEAYYQVSLSREETGAVIIPDIPLRLHPGIRKIQAILKEGTLGKLQNLRFEVPIKAGDEDLLSLFSNLVDAVRAVAGEPEAIWAMGQPRGTTPRTSLTVYLDMAGEVRAEISLFQPYSDFRRMFLNCEHGSMVFDHNPDSLWPAKLNIHAGNSGTETIAYENWIPYDALFDVVELSLTMRGQSGRTLPHPNLDDGIRAMELTEAVVRSLKRERKINLHFQAISEEANFKSVMTSTGCMILLAILFVLPLSIAGKALGLPFLIYVSYLIPFALGVFILMQMLRLAVRPSPSGRNNREPSAKASDEGLDVESI